MAQATTQLEGFSPVQPPIAFFVCTCCIDFRHCKARLGRVRVSEAIGGYHRQIYVIEYKLEHYPNLRFPGPIVPMSCVPRPVIGSAYPFRL